MDHLEARARASLAPIMPSDAFDSRSMPGAKRAFDLLGAVLVLLLLAPLLGAIALAVRMSSPGPIIFRQLRVGRHGRHFYFLKFRSMRVDVSKDGGERATAAGKPPGSLVKSRRDPRITPVGAVLRRLSLDELPQLLNVVAGDMSLVGPRPLIAFMLEPYPDLARVRARVRPGLTGLWQIRCREKNESVLDMAAHDLEYVRRQSLCLDLRILVATIPVVLSTRGAI